MKVRLKWVTNVKAHRAIILDEFEIGKTLDLKDFKMKTPYCINVENLKLTNSFMTGVAEFEEVKENTMTKDDLKTGMVVETRGGKRYLVLGKRILMERKHINFYQYRENLLIKHTRDEFDIVKIYEGSENLFGMDELNDDRKEVLTLIWERNSNTDQINAINAKIEELKAEVEKLR